MSGTDLSVEVIRERLAAAQDAYHKLAIGKLARVYVDTDGTRIEYTAANRGALNAYIQELIAALARAENAATQFRGPLQFVL